MSPLRIKFGRRFSPLFFRRNRGLRDGERGKQRDAKDKKAHEFS